METDQHVTEVTKVSKVLAQDKSHGSWGQQLLGEEGQFFLRVATGGLTILWRVLTHPRAYVQAQSGLDGFLKKRVFSYAPIWVCLCPWAESGSLETQNLMAVLLACRHHKTCRDKACTPILCPCECTPFLSPEGEAGGM